MEKVVTSGVRDKLRRDGASVKKVVNKYLRSLPRLSNWLAMLSNSDAKMLSYPSVTQVCD